MQLLQVTKVHRTSLILSLSPSFSFCVSPLGSSNHSRLHSWTGNESATYIRDLVTVPALSPALPNNRLTKALFLLYYMGHPSLFVFRHEVRPCERLIENISLRSLPFVGMGINRGTRHRTTTSFLSTVAPSRWINEIFNVHEEANNANNGIMVQIDSAGCKSLAMVSPTRTTVQTTLGSNEIPGTSKDRMIRPSCLCGSFPVHTCTGWEVATVT